VYIIIISSPKKRAKIRSVLRKFLLSNCLKENNIPPIKTISKKTPVTRASKRNPIQKADRTVPSVCGLNII
jgi:hypothetical protein